MFDPAYRITLGFEGGFSNHPKDPGGATNKGVTQAVYDAYRRLKGLPMRSVRLIEDAEVRAIYLQQYWRPIMGDALPAGVGCAVYDFAVNSGVSRASKFLQRIVGVDPDGQIGYRTLDATREAATINEVALVGRICVERMAFVRSLGTFATFGNGWTRRIMGNTTGAQPGRDVGIIDYATAIALNDPVYGQTIPTPQPAKALPAADEAVYQPAAPISYADLKAGRWALQ